jgi:Galactose oxidase, central domain
MRFLLTVIILPALVLALSCDRAGHQLELEPNIWTQVLQENQGARRFSSFRYAPDINRFLLWGFHGFYTEYYGNPELPWDGNEEYDLVAFNPMTGRWENHLPHNKMEEWSEDPPPMHLIGCYQGITPGYYRPQLKEREGVLRPDLNIVGDQVTYDSKRKRMVYFIGGRTFAYHVEQCEWSAIDGEQSPPPVSFGSLCYDPFGDRIILSGGGHVAETGPEGGVVGYTGTWSYDCASGEWSSLETGGEPPPRMCTRLVCDTKNRAMVLFGGDGQSCWRADTWILDLESDTWRKSKAPGAPDARAGHFTVYDPSTGWVIVGGGYNHVNLGDMLGYDVSSDTWRKLRGEVPLGWYVTADIIPHEGVILLTTSTKREGDTHGCNEIYPVRTTWAYRIERPGLVDESTHPRPEHELLKRPVEQAVAGTEQDPVRHKEQMERIRKMKVNRWIRFDGAGRDAPLRTWGSCAFDTDKSRIVYWGGGHCGYGGSDYDFYDVEQNTWVSSPLEAVYPERAWDLGINPGGGDIQRQPLDPSREESVCIRPCERKKYQHKGGEPDGGLQARVARGYRAAKSGFRRRGELYPLALRQVGHLGLSRGQPGVGDSLQRPAGSRPAGANPARGDGCGPQLGRGQQ